MKNGKQIQRKTNAGVCQGHDGSGMEENIAVVAEGGPQVMYKSFDLKRRRTSLIKKLSISSSFILTKPQKHLYVGCAERREKV